MPHGYYSDTYGHSAHTHILAYTLVDDFSAIAEAVISDDTATDTIENSSPKPPSNQNTERKGWNCHLSLGREKNDMPCV